MKAIFFEQYGTTADLKIKEVTKPTPAKNEVLVKVCACGVNDYDWCFVRGKPWLYRLIFGLLKPRQNIPGMEISGVIEEVGSNVKAFEIGDSVYGDISEFGFGGFAEYVCVNQKALVRKPQGMTFTQAAALSHASRLALQGLINVGKLDKGEKGKKILINGAGGGVGVYAVQIAKLYDAEVTGVDLVDKFEKMKSLGYDNVIDYRMENFTKKEKKYDLILDTKTTFSPLACLRTLKPNGVYVSIGGSILKLMMIPFFGFFFSLLSKKKLLILVMKTNQRLDFMNKLFKKNKLQFSIDNFYYLREVPSAIEYFGSGKHIGKVVVTIASVESEQ